MNLTDKVVIPAQVMARQVGDETVILDLASGTYFGLDPVGARIWELMGEGKTLAQVCDVMQAEFEVTREDIERDVLDLVEKLHAQQLISAD
jgi:hypothetical protein